MRTLSIFAFFCSLCLSAQAVAQTTSAPGPAVPLRTLVYAMSFDVRQSGEVSNDPGTSGAKTYSGGIGDMGTITVTVMREEEDHGLIVSIREQAQNGRSADPATCVAYASTDVICDPNVKVNSEEYSLLRFLAPNFVDPNKIVANHWQIAHQDSSEKLTANYAITNNANGIMQITESRLVDQRASGTLTSNIQTKIIYDFNRLLPTSVDEYDIQRQYGGAEATSTSTYQTTLKLTSDSMAKP